MNKLFRISLDPEKLIFRRDTSRDWTLKFPWFWTKVERVEISDTTWPLRKDPYCGEDGRKKHLLHQHLENFLLSALHFFIGVSILNNPYNLKLNNNKNLYSAWCDWGREWCWARPWPWAAWAWRLWRCMPLNVRPRHCSEPLSGHLSPKWKRNV